MVMVTGIVNFLSKKCPTNFSLSFAIVSRFLPLKRLLSTSRDKLKLVGQGLLPQQNAIDWRPSPRNEDLPLDLSARKPRCMNKWAKRVRDRIATAPPDHPDANDKNQEHPNLFHPRNVRRATALPAGLRTDCVWPFLHARSKSDRFQAPLCTHPAQTVRPTIRSIHTGNPARRARGFRLDAVD